MGINHLNTRGDRSQHNQNYDSDIFGQGQDYTSCMKKRKETITCLNSCNSIMRNTYSQDFGLGGGMEQPSSCVHRCGGLPLICPPVPRNYEQGNFFNQG